MKYVDYDIVFQDVPNEVTLAFNISNCPNYCLGCHSKHLWQDIGTEMTNETILALIEKYRGEITCVCIMGGDREVARVTELCHLIKSYGIHTAWYSGQISIPKDLDLTAFDYIKIGPYNETLGALKSPTTNQRMYQVLSDLTLTDITAKFWKNP